MLIFKLSDTPLIPQNNHKLLGECGQVLAVWIFQASSFISRARALILICGFGVERGELILYCVRNLQMLQSLQHIDFFNFFK
jgi:hypothetical protein